MTRPTSPRTTRRRRAARREILDAAWSLLDAEGAAALTADAIAARADISKASVFYYFPSMEQVFGELLREELHAYAAALTAAVEACDEPRSVLGEVVRLTHARYTQRPERFILIGAVPLTRGAAAVGLEDGEVARSVDPPFNAFIDVVEARLAEVDLPQGVDPRRAAVAAHMAAMGAVLLCHTTRAAGGGFARPESELVDELAGLLERGVTR